MYYDLFSKLNQDILVLTANQRLSQQLQQQFDQQQQKKYATWESANILPLTVWLIEQWQTNPRQQQTIISEEQALLLWRTIISNDPDVNNVLQINLTAKLAQQAWEHIELWQINRAALNNDNTPATQKFLSWSQQFQALKKAKHAITWAEIPTQLPHQAMRFPKKIILVDAHHLPPAIRHFFTTISSKIEYFNPSNINQTIQKASIKGEDQEIIAMAQWAKQQWQALPANSNHHIACIIPKLKSKRDKITRLFCEVFSTEKELATPTHDKLPYNISIGENFHQNTLIASALKVLQLSIARKYTHEQLSAVVRSTYINNNPCDAYVAAMAEQEICRQHTLGPHTVQRLLERLVSEHYPASTLAQRWNAFCGVSKQTGSNSYQHWSQQFTIILNAIGWPGQRSLNSLEQQTLQRWQQLLLDFAALDKLMSACTQHQAVDHFIYLCQQLVFQPETKAKPIQILGILEASGIPFQHSWLMGLDNENWPPKASPNPFLPIELQRQHQLPHSSANIELLYAQQLQQHLISSSNHIVLSFCEQTADRAQHASALIDSITAEMLPLCATVTQRQASKLESIVDHQAPSITPHEEIRGGSTILATQAKCPFQAFANIRLNTRFSEPIAIGLSAAQRGTICHHALDFVWKTLATQQQLLALSEAQQAQVINDALTKACDAVDMSYQHFLTVEKQRLTELLTNWLELEKTRPSFTVVEHETTQHVQIKELTIRIQIDRIDEDQDGQRLIIDYKTGKQHKISDWFAPRLTELQLPLYSVFGSQQTIGISYAKVNGTDLKFAGIIDDHTGFSDIKPLQQYQKGAFTWETLNTQWQHSIEQLSDDFFKGDARVDPWHADACTYCQLQALCRIHEVKAL